ncbi:MAG TPA: 3-isopropylmalate dehydratase small subunit [Beijerinckiaceae bacterium]|jgi:3-isopropylmalate/(R)-2-methylmalate dehydratase small subunit
MEPFRQLSARACPLALANVDTDQILPARFLKRPRAEGHAAVLFHDLRFDAEGRPRPEFPLNRPQWVGARILVARRNFGAGSSRESAVYALVDYGIRCVIAPSFGDIFAGNAVNNGLVPARVPEAEAEELIAALEQGLAEVAVDLEAQSIRAGDRAVAFAIDPVWRTKLLNGWDDLDLTASYSREIAAFAAADAARRPWTVPRLDGTRPNLGAAPDDLDPRSVR